MTWIKSLGWWLGQSAQDWMAPEVSRPTSLDPEALHLFLTQLPWHDWVGMHWAWLWPLSF